jgi:hypothetical protein
VVVLNALVANIHGWVKINSAGINKNGISLSSLQVVKKVF